ncbi:MAG: metallophosphoesterase family protein [Caldimonas sp.]
MRTLVHLSDLHFGRTDPALIEPLLSIVQASAPDCVVISGDLTQRARLREFREAREFLDRLSAPRIVVPGNHDVPLYRVWERLLDPLGNYRRYIDAEVETSFIDAEIAVVGVNTARALAFKGGRINAEQIESIRRRLAALPAQAMKIVVTHHPFDLPDSPGHAERVGGAGQAMEVFSTCGVDLLLAGHFHTSHAGDTSAHHDLPGYAALVIQAGTATSTRGRGESNSFNILRVGDGAVTVERHVWQPSAGIFTLERAERFSREAGRWGQG